MLGVPGLLVGPGEGVGVRVHGEVGPGQVGHVIVIFVLVRHVYGRVHRAARFRVIVEQLGLAQDRTESGRVGSVGVSVRVALGCFRGLVLGALPVRSLDVTQRQWFQPRLPGDEVTVLAVRRGDGTRGGGGAWGWVVRLPAASYRVSSLHGRPRLSVRRPTAVLRQ